MYIKGSRLLGAGLNLTLTCYYFDTLLLSRDVNKDGGGSMTFSLNLTLTYYFETLLSRDVNNPRRLPDVNKVPDGFGSTAILNLK